MVEAQRRGRFSVALSTWLLGTAPAIESAADKARAAGFLYATGGLVAVVTLLLPHDGTTSEPGVVGVAVLAAATGTFLLAVGGRLPGWAFHVLTVCGTWMIAIAVEVGGNMGTAYELFYIWVAIYIFYFFTPAQALGHSGMIAVAAFTAVIHPSPGATAPEAHWLTTVSTGVAAGVLVERLVVRIRRFGRSDYLTGLANRRIWDALLPGRLRRHRKASVVLLDIDHFKIYNDEYGVRRGDHLLREFAVLLDRSLPADGATARYGGDELVVLVPAGLDDVVAWVDRLRPATPGGQAFSAGVAEWDGVEPAAALMVRADSALRAAKLSGRDRTLTTGTDAGGLAVNWPRAVAGVLAGDGLEAYFQPLVRLDDRAQIGFEALARPREVAGGTAGVESLFATAQFMGRAVDLDLLCHRVAAEASRALPAGGLLFLNTSVATILQPESLLKSLLDDARRAGRAPHQIVIEVTERETVLNVQRLSEACRRVRSAGFGIALDDVGHARSSLAVLAALQPDYIKVTSELIVSDDPASLALVRALLQYAGETGAQVVAEGVESVETAERVGRLGVPLAQGYLFGRPAPAGAA